MKRLQTGWERCHGVAGEFLRDLCISLGWDWQYTVDDFGNPIGYVAWAKAQLGDDE